MMRTREMPPAEALKNIDELLLAVGPATGQLMNTLIKESKAQTILEIGTLHGSPPYGWRRGRATGGKVITLDVHAGKQEYARKELSKAGLASLVEFKLGDARIDRVAPALDRFRVAGFVEGSLHNVLRSFLSEAESQAR